MKKIDNFIKKHYVFFLTLILLVLVPMFCSIVYSIIPLVPSLDPDAMAASPEMQLAFYYLAFIVVLWLIVHCGIELLTIVFKLIYEKIRRRNKA